MRVTFCGVRGSTPAPGAAFVRYGGQTSSVVVARDGAAPDLLLDAGTGLQNVSALLPDGVFRGTALLGHLHWDHTHGMPFFAGGFADGARVDVHIPAQGTPGQSAHDVLARGFSPPHFPIVPSQLGPGWTFSEVDDGLHRIEGYDVLVREIPHKGGRTVGFRVSDATASIAYLSDHSPTSVGPGPDGLGERHDAVLALATGVDLLVHDAQHVAAQFPGVGFLGHASVEYAVELAAEAEVGVLALYHHAPSRTDDEVDAILADARRLAGGRVDVVAASEGLVIDLPTPPDTERNPHVSAVHDV